MASVEALEAEVAALREKVVSLEASEKALRDSQRLLEVVVDNSPSVIFVKDVEGRHLLVNRRFEQLFGPTPPQILGKTDAELLPEGAEEIRKKDLEVMAGGEIVLFEEDVPVPGEGVRTYWTVKFPIRDAQGEVAGVCGIATDITDQKRDQTERIALQEEVIAAQQAALHELSTPLVPIAEGVLAMPIVGVIDGVRARKILESLLEGVSRQQAHTAILDITGVRVVDTQVANALVGAAKAARMLGARVVLTGISPEIAQTLVHLEADLGGITTLSTLQSGIAHALAGSAAAGVRKIPVANGGRSD